MTVPHVIVHASVTVDGAVTGFMPDLGAHYAVTAGLDCDAHLVGSVTMRTGLEMDASPPADPGPGADRPPADRERQPHWFLVDSRGGLMGHLHALRAFPGLRDVVVLVSGSTSPEYRAYLTTRRYATIEAGDDRVDLRRALEIMHEDYRVRRVLVDSGPVLTSVLLDAGLVDEVSLLLHPVLVGGGGDHLFARAEDPRRLRQTDRVDLADGLTHVRYEVLADQR